MTLVDTSVWIDHGMHSEARLVDLLDAGEVYSHVYIAGELAMGTFRKRELFLELHGKIPQAIVVTPDELLHFVRQHRLHGRGIGYIDAHLLASVQLMQGTRLWTRDKRLADAARALDVPCVAEYSN